MRAVVVLALSSLAAGCVIDGRGRERDRPPEWLELGTGIADRHQTANDPVRDSGSLSIGGGFDLADGPVRPAIELEVLGSRHDIADSVSPGNDPTLQVIRYLAGLRVQADVPNTPLSLYARGGWLWRDEHESPDGIGIQHDQYGYYLGAGFEWWYTPCASLGPYVLFTRGNDDSRRETLFGITAHFCLPPD